MGCFATFRNEAVHVEYGRFAASLTFTKRYSQSFDFDPARYDFPNRCFLSFIEI